MKTIRKYASLWAKLTTTSFLTVLSTRFGSSLFLLAKILRFSFFMIFLFTLLSKTNHLSQYTMYQTIFFFVSFTVLDTLAQLFYREVYRFRYLVVSGDFDLVLVKPINALFRALAGGADPLDLIMLIPYIGLLVWTGSQLGDITPGRLLGYVLLMGNGFLIATGFHILILSLAVLTTEIDHTIMIYRDITSLARFPVDIYREPIRFFITFIVPVGVMMTFPAKAMMGLVAPVGIGLSILFGIIFFMVCLRIWSFALTKYASASS